MKIDLSTKTLNYLAKKLNKYKKCKYHTLFKINNVSQNDVKKSDIYVYFASGFKDIYQIDYRFFSVLKELNKVHNLIFVTRNYKVYRYLKNNYSLNVVYFHYLNDLISFYEKNNPKIILYMNNYYKNFQSLIYQDAMHIYMDNEESNLFLGYSNQVKAYDYIFINSIKAYDSYKFNILKLDKEQLVNIGRPQLDLIKSMKLDTKGKKVILYAPTWESSDIVTRYTSVEDKGIDIVKNILDSNKYYVIYAPHANLGKNDRIIKKKHKKILRMIKKNSNAIAIEYNDLFNVYPLVDYAIFDFSSAIIDYLAFDKPYSIVEMTKDISIEDNSLLEYSKVLNKNSIETINNFLEDEITNDNYKKQRGKLKSLYINNYPKGKSIEMFLDSISCFIKQRDKELLNLQKAYNE